MTPTLDIRCGCVLTHLAFIPDNSVQCCITSPPYWGLRDYGVEGQFGLEASLEEFLERQVEVFREVRRVLRPDGTLWLNMGDAYAGGGNGGGGSFAKDGIRAPRIGTDKNIAMRKGSRGVGGRFKAKDLMGQPWRLAFALQDDGWYLRRDIIWHKPNAMPESAPDRPATAHEYLFLLSKARRYFYDRKAVMEPCTGNAHPRGKGINAKVSGWADGTAPHRAINHARPGGSYKGSVPGRKDVPGQDRRSKRPRQNAYFSAAVAGLVEMRNKRSVWSIPTEPFKGAHFATFPQRLVKPCVLAGSRSGDTVLDIYGGRGTVGLVANQLGRHAILIELNPDTVALARE